MAQVIQAKCPGCKKVLRIPTDWVHQAIKCKHCGTVLQARTKAKAAPAVAPPPLPRRTTEVIMPATVMPPFETADGTIIRTKYRRPSSGLWWKALLAVLV